MYVTYLAFPLDDVSLGTSIRVGIVSEMCKRGLPFSKTKLSAPIRVTEMH